MTELLKLDTKAALDDVRARKVEVEARLSELARERDEATARRQELVRKRALGRIEPTRAEAELAEADDRLASIEGDARLAHETAEALDAERARLNDQRRAEQAAERRGEVARLAAEREAALAQLDSAVVQLIKSWENYLEINTEIKSKARELSESLADREVALRAAFAERTANVHQLPDSVHTIGPRYAGQALAEVGGAAAALVAAFDRCAAQ